MPLHPQPTKPQCLSAGSHSIPTPPPTPPWQTHRHPVAAPNCSVHPGTAPPQCQHPHTPQPPMPRR
ncbi:hypothetical protein CRENBAI_013264, partial [Crenichthys baileyi]